MEPADRQALLARLSENPSLANFECTCGARTAHPLVLEKCQLAERVEGGPILEGTISISRTEARPWRPCAPPAEAKYRVLLIENLEQSIFLKDRELRFVAANKNFCACLGHTEAEIVGKSDYDFYPPSWLTSIGADDLQVLVQGRVIHTQEQTCSTASCGRCGSSRRP